MKEPLSLWQQTSHCKPLHGVINMTGGEEGKRVSRMPEKLVSLWSLWFPLSIVIRSFHLMRVTRLNPITALKERMMRQFCMDQILSNTTGFLSEIGTKLRDWAVGQAGGSCYSWAALSSNDSKTLYSVSNFVFLWLLMMLGIVGFFFLPPGLNLSPIMPMCYAALRLQSLP